MAGLKKISVVSVLNKGMRFYTTALKSFLYQTYIDVEWIIIDNTGRNVLREKLNRYLKGTGKIKVFANERELNQAQVLQEAFSLCDGEFIAFLDLNDYWTRDKLSKQVAFMLRFMAPLCHTSYAFGDDKCNLLSIGCYHSERELNMLNYSVRNPVSNSTLMIARDKVMLDFSRYELDNSDFDFMTFLLKHGLVSSGLSDVMTLCRPIFDKEKQNKIDSLIRQLLIENPDDKTTRLRVLEHYARSALNVEGLRLDPSICIGYDVVTSLKILRDYKI